MSLITRCPTCATTFKVVPDQLRISDGWVRCGRCGEVFDAPLNMCAVPELDASPEPGLLPADSLDPAADTDKPSNAPTRTVIDAQWWQNQPSLDMPVAAAMADVASHDEISDTTGPGIEKVATGPVEAPVMTFRAAVDEDVSENTSRSNPAFMPGFLKTKAPSAPRRSRARGWLTVLVVIALCALLIQIVFHERDFIVARQPTLKPLLTSLCRQVGCEVSEPRQIASITVDGVSFSREPEGDGYGLYFSLRNRAGMTLKMPAVELTLLDAQERPVLRRVLAPSDFGASTVLPPHAVRTASLVLTLSSAEAAALPPLAGYHVEPFYP